MCNVLKSNHFISFKISKESIVEITSTNQELDKDLWWHISGSEPIGA